MRFLITALLVLSPFAAFAQGAFQCDTIISNGLREYRIDSTSTSYLTSTFKQYCQETGEKKNDSGGIGLDFVVKQIPVKFTGTYSSSSEAMTNFCKTYSNSTDYKNSTYSYSDTIVSKAYDTYAQCVQLASLGLSVSHDFITEERTQVLLRAGVARPIEIVGVDTSSNVKCYGPNNQGKSVQYSVGTKLSSANTISVFCSREGRRDANGITTYEEGSVAFGITGYKYNFFWPRSARLPEDLASKVETSLNELRTNIAALAAREAIAVEATTEAAANGAVGGTSAIDLTASCPSGQLMTGIRMHLGGTCHRQCDPDGRPVSTFAAICAPTKLSH